MRAHTVSTQTLTTDQSSQALSTVRPQRRPQAPSCWSTAIYLYRYGLDLNSVVKSSFTSDKHIFKSNADIFTLISPIISLRTWLCTLASVSARLTILTMSWTEV